MSGAEATRTVVPAKEQLDGTDHVAKEAANKRPPKPKRTAFEKSLRDHNDARVVIREFLQLKIDASAREDVFSDNFRSGDSVPPASSVEREQEHRWASKIPPADVLAFLRFLIKHPDFNRSSDDFKRTLYQIHDLIVHHPFDPQSARRLFSSLCELNAKNGVRLVWPLVVARRGDYRPDQIVDALHDLASVKGVKVEVRDLQHVLRPLSDEVVAEMPFRLLYQLVFAMHKLGARCRPLLEKKLMDPIIDRLHRMHQSRVVVSPLKQDALAGRAADGSLRDAKFYQTRPKQSFGIADCFFSQRAGILNPALHLALMFDLDFELDTFESYELDKLKTIFGTWAGACHAVPKEWTKSGRRVGGHVKKMMPYRINYSTMNRGAHHIWEFLCRVEKARKLHYTDKKNHDPDMAFSATKKFRKPRALLGTRDSTRDSADSRREEEPKNAIEETLRGESAEDQVIQKRKKLGRSRTRYRPLK